MSLAQLKATVKFFAQSGLDEASQSPELFHKWLTIWSLGLVGEIGELYKSKDNYEALSEEIADVLWYTLALDMLLDLNIVTDQLLTPPVPGTPVDITGAIVKALEFTEKVKKYVRDYPLRPLSSLTGYEAPGYYLVTFINGTRSPKILQDKLSKRYPNGFNPTDSVNR